MQPPIALVKIFGLVAVTIALPLLFQKAYAQDLRSLLDDPAIGQFLRRAEEANTGARDVQRELQPALGGKRTERAIEGGFYQEAADPPSRLELFYEERLRRLGPDAERRDQEMPEAQMPRQQPQADARDAAEDRPLTPRELAALRDRLNSQEPEIRQFGYAALRRVSLMGGGEPYAVGGVADDYIVGAGDEMIITFRGQKNETYRTRVDREGRIILPELAPVMAAGRPFADVREELQDAAGRSLLQTDIFVSLGEVRRISVTIAGEVRQPGSRAVSGLSSLIEALIAAGGVDPAGSLRDIRVIRGGRETRVDLYGVLTGVVRGGSDITLQDGDRIVVPAIGPTIAVAGAVQRQGIFEIRDGITAAQALELAGGAFSPQSNKLVRVYTDAQGRDVMDYITHPTITRLSASDILLVMDIGGGTARTVDLRGHVEVPGQHALDALPDAAALAAREGLLKEGAYLPFVIVKRRDPLTRYHSFIPLDLTHVIAGRFNMRFQENDTLVVLSRNDVRFLSSPALQRVLRQGEWREKETLSGQPLDPPAGRGLEELQANMPAPTPRDPARGKAERDDRDQGPECRSLRYLSREILGSRDNRFSTAIVAGRDLAEAREGQPFRQDCPDIFERDPQLLSLLLEHSVILHGEVRAPGSYPILPETPLSVLVALAQGLNRAADLSAVELTRFPVSPDAAQVEAQALRQTLDVRSASLEQIALSPGDVIRFNRAFSARDDGPVTLSGEFRRPGIYNIRRGETMSELFARAGGVTAQAYPLGAVVTRESIRIQEQETFQRFARDVRSALAYAVAAEGQSAGPGQIAALTQMLETVREAKAIGRIVTETDPTILAVHPERDVLLHPGDRIHMPKRPSHVMVTGEVQNPGALAHVSDASAQDYVRLAGGLGIAADPERAFAILPNGQAEPLSITTWGTSNTRLPPGTTIVVPRDPAPFNIRFFLRDWLDITYKAALSAASINTLTRD